MAFSTEADFERALIDMLQHYGWQDVLKYPTEQDLLQNWANILFENNRGIDRLNGCPLVPEEMEQILEQIRKLRTPLALNGFINGKTVAIRRQNPADTLHYGKEVSLKIYDRMEIAAGQSRYQIAEQPRFLRRKKVLNDRRGDVLLLINGMPVFHIELKRSGIPVSEACHQIETYAHEQVFTELFSLVQVFVAMTPDDAVYFANPGPQGRFNPDFFFRWANFNNEPITNWKTVASTLLSIPMAHQLIGFYTVADTADGILKVMRSYQYFAANRISDRVAKHDWDDRTQLGGYIWHTTGSGKTMTSFKSAQLIANSKDADKVVFLMDRVELETQSLKEYRAFADNADDVQQTEDTVVLIRKLVSTNPADTLIVTSIQKMSNIKEDAEGRMKAHDLERIQAKRLVFIIDECHRSTFGTMLYTIKQTFPRALFFGFTGTPVFRENEKKLNTTADVFGNELHRYSLSDGIRDKNVLGFDPSMVMVYPDRKLRECVALQEAKAATIEEALGDPKKSKKYYDFMAESKVPMAGYYGEDGKYVKGIEDYCPKAQFETDEYQDAVVKDICDHWLTMSRNHTFHAIFATSSIPEGITYYRKFKAYAPKLRVTGLFDPTIDNVGGSLSLAKEDGLVEMLEDYNHQYDRHYTLGTYKSGFKRDVAARLSHKRPYERLQKEQQLDLLIVVNQMLTGFDSKWVNTLYLDKVLEHQNLIQAFSRTNRLFNINEKPFGSIRYYRLPHTMKRNIEDAVKLYSGEKPMGLFADHLPENIQHLNDAFTTIQTIFTSEQIENFERLPDDMAARAKFAKVFREFMTYLQAAEIQGFTWEQRQYAVTEDYLRESFGASIDVVPEEKDYQILLQRYAELRRPGDDPGGDGDLPFPIDPYLTELSTGVIDNDYMNSRFEKWRKQLEQDPANAKAIAERLAELHKSFAFLSQEDQKYANLFLHDVASGDVPFPLTPDKTFRDYVSLYANRAQQEQVDRVVLYLGCSREKLQSILDAHVTEKNINEYGRFQALMDTVVKEKAKAYVACTEKRPVPPPLVNVIVQDRLKKFILSDGKGFEDIPELDKE